MADLRHSYDPSEITPANIRNVCILAHVDHGKTSIADCLLSLNGFVSKRGIGTTRYMDDRKDEQERQITMKTSVVSIVDILVKGAGVKESIPVILNLVDTPGHIDFSSEVTSAVRICDGALIVVDAVEGVCAQTKVAMKQAYDEKLSMILIINKIDRLLLDLKQDAKVMCQSLIRVVEDCNVYLSHLYHMDLSTNPDKEQDSDLRFCPELGNVIFASAIDGWGFTLRHIAKMYSLLVKNETEESLTKKLWNFDCYIGSKDKLLKEGAMENNKQCVFVQLVTSMLYYVYSNLVIRQRLDSVDDIIKKLCLTVTPSHWLYKDGRSKLRCVMEAWQPLGKTIMLQSFLYLPSPCHMDMQRIYYLLNMERYVGNLKLSEKLATGVHALNKCSKDGPAIAYISKMLVINKDMDTAPVAPIFYPKPKTDDKQNSAKTSEQRDAPGGDKQDSSRTSSEERDAPGDDKQDSPKTFSQQGDTPRDGQSISEEVISNTEGEEQEEKEYSKYEVMAIIKIYSGVIHVNQELFLVTASHSPIEFLVSDDKPRYIETHDCIKKVKIRGVHVLLGRERHSVAAMGAGYICGITGFEDIVCHKGTLLTSLYTTPVREQSTVEPIVYNVINPLNPNDLPALRNGLRLLQQSDSCVKVILNKAGEHMLVTAGEVHLEKCLEDLRNKFGEIDFTVSDPIYPLRETISHESDKVISRVVTTGNDYVVVIDINVLSIPDEIVELIQGQYSVFKAIQEFQEPSLADIRMRHDRNELRIPKEKQFRVEIGKGIVSRLKSRLRAAFDNYTKWKPLSHENIWMISSGQDNINLLMNCVPGYECNIFTTPDELDNRVFVENHIVNAFNMVCSAGPLCEEPLMNCAFLIKTLTVSDEVNRLITLDAQQANSLTQQFRVCFRDALMNHTMGLMEPVLATFIQTDVTGIGKLYSEVHKRYGKITDQLSLDESLKQFTVKALLPAVESRGFAGKVRKISSGGANPSLFFSHYELVEANSESDDETDERETMMRSHKLLKDIRARKGLAVVDAQVVLHAEKQRTFKRK